jgi:uncharacterized protein (TIGR02246 family)
MRTLTRHMALIGALALAGCAAEGPPPAEPPDTRADDEAAIRAAIEDWSASAQAKDAAKFASFYTEDGILMLEQMANLQGPTAIEEAHAAMMRDPSFDLSFAADHVEVARSGDLAYETGSYTMTMSDPEGNPATHTGHYVVVWKKDAAGSWKVAVDVPVSDPPAE